MSFFLNSFNYAVIVSSVGSGFSILIDTTKAGTTTNTQFNLALAPSTSYDFNIDWGDNVIESYTSSNTTGYTHTYPASGTYLISIGERSVGGFPRVYYNNVGDKLKLLNVTQFGGNQFGTDWTGSFKGCTNLQLTATDFATAKTQNITNFNAAWSRCASLLSFPLIDTSNATSLQGTWEYCTSLSSFPLLNTSKVTNFGSAFINCPIKSFPLIDTSKCTNFSSMLYGTKIVDAPLLNTLSGTNFNAFLGGCTELTGVPLFDLSNATDVSTLFSSSNKLKSIPLFNTSKAINFRFFTADCTSLTSFPLIDTSKGTNFEWAWQNCNKLASFPLINTSKGTNFSAAWQNCTSLTSFPLIDTSKGTEFSSAWTNCNKLTSFPSINTLSGVSFSFAWDDCTSLTSFPLIDTSNGTNFYAAWQNCTSLTSFPLIDTSKGTNISTAWYNCNKLKSFPLINTLSATHIGGAWSDCTSLTSFPLIDTRNVKFLYSGSTGGAWENCSSLSSFPLIDTSKVIEFIRAWQNCSSLSSFPLINTLSGTSFNNTWYGCRNLKSFPPLDFSKATGTNNFNGTWENCTNLTSFPTITATNSFGGTWSNCINLTALGPNSYLKFIGGTGATNTFGNCVKLIALPAMDTLSATSLGTNSYNLGPWNNCISLTSFPLIDTRNVTTFYGTWQNCISLSATDFPTLNMSKMTNGTGCFQGVKLTTTSYSALLTSLCATNFNNTVTFHGGNSNYNSTVPQVTASRNFLVTPVVSGGRGWTITDGGPDIDIIFSTANQYWYTNFETGSATKTTGSALTSDIRVIDDNGSVLGTQFYQGTKSYYCNSRTNENAGLTFVVNPTAFNNTKGFIIDFMVYKVSGDNYPTMLGVGLSSRDVLVNQQLFPKNYYGLRWLGTNYGSVIAQTTGGVSNVVANNTSWGAVNNWHRITYYYNNVTKYGIIYVDGVGKQTALQERGWNTLPDGNILIGLFNYGTNGESGDNGIEAYIDNLGFYTL